jgi:hypothetical protein
VITEHPVGIARDVAALRDSLADLDPQITVAEFLIAHNTHWGIVERVQSVATPVRRSAGESVVRGLPALGSAAVPIGVVRDGELQPAVDGLVAGDLVRGCTHRGRYPRGTNQVDDWLFLPRPQEIA